jgi:hypothetical protein
MFRGSIGIVTAGVLACLSTGQAVALTAVRPLEGYACMDLNLTDEEMRNFGSLPPVFAAPKQESKKIGVATSTVFVVSPIREVNGFVEMLRLNGQRGWIASKMLRSHRSIAVPPLPCTPSLMSNGKPGFG